ncbi:MAG: hypothetical protein ACOYN3_04135 [Acidimicrobiia bacterium]
MAEIEAEARAQRVQGDIPASYEAELDAMFNRLAPKGTYGDFDEALRQSTANALIDGAPPISSQRPGGAAAKKGLGKLSRWYIQHIANQVTLFAANITEAVRTLGDRVGRLEASGANGATPGARRLAEQVLPFDVTTVWDTHIEKQFAGVGGRVCVARVGRGDLVRRLNQAGVAAYGVEPIDPPTADQIDVMLEIRTEELLDHLRRIDGPQLEGIVLVDYPDRLVLGDLITVVERCSEVLVPGGQLVVVTSDARAWAQCAGGAIADVTVGHPLAPATWVQLLSIHGFTEIEAAAEAAQQLVTPISGDGPEVEAMNAALLSLEALLAVPPSYCIAARKLA